MRATHSNVLDMDSAIDSNGQLAVAAISSKDTVKIFVDKNENNNTFMEQSCEFQSTEDVPTCISFYGGQNYVAVGFDSGWVRVFDITNTSVLKSLKISETEIIKL
jgi:WD40 repeat protein